jgi:hypothetical protein
MTKLIPLEEIEARVSELASLSQMQQQMVDMYRQSPEFAPPQLIAAAIQSFKQQSHGLNLLLSQCEEWRQTKPTGHDKRQIARIDRAIKDNQSLNDDIITTMEVLIPKATGKEFTLNDAQDTLDHLGIDEFAENLFSEDTPIEAFEEIITKVSQHVSPEPKELPLSVLPQILDAATQMLDVAEEQLVIMEEVQKRPSSLDDALVKRMQRLSENQTEDCHLFLLQCQNWLEQKPSKKQTTQIHQIQKFADKTIGLNKRILFILDHVKEHTINKILENDNLALDILNKKTYSPFDSEEKAEAVFQKVIQNAENDLSGQMTEIEIIQKIHTSVMETLKNGGSEEDILIECMIYMDRIQPLLATPEKLDKYCDQYEGFFKFMKLIEKLATAMDFIKKQDPYPVD